MATITDLTRVMPMTVPMSMHAEQRARLARTLREKSTVPDSSLVLMESARDAHRYDTDNEPIFRQESYFLYLFGVRDPGFYGVINVGTGRTTLFMPRLPEEYAVWMGRLKSPEEVRAQYEVDEVKYVDELEGHVKAAAPESLLVMQGRNTDSGATYTPASFSGIEAFRVDSTTLFPVLADQRVFKTEAEVAVMRYANDLSSEAHLAVMRACKAGMWEFQLESIFRHSCHALGGARLTAYTPIAASGANGSVLHYGHAGEPNERRIGDGDMCLLDFGCEFHCYASDITCSFPANGKFTPNQRLVYEAVLAAQWAVLDALRPGVAWPSMQELTYRVLLQHLKDGGVLTGDVEEMMAANLGATFMPHGLGHFIGIDTHDVGGYLEGSPERSKLPGFKSLRTSRVLQPGMAITVEPGMYFNDYLLDKALADDKLSRFIVRERLAEFRGFGGVRIEDNVVVREDGVENLTSVPRTVAEVEAAMAGEITSRDALVRKFYRSA